ncbi:MAG: CDP-diacylglycerol--glycerol-3-phosphate 3-phosphatidyltransferase [Cyanobacteria bacterium]|nr:CDP-diacylglycerol--glycerol-3-phosphate 3-phosphatidyltransferase [Cyanobacteria bacterium CG_2015-16_32_12]NCO78763.1 CDP-diacylglycerol--glycerol-3-phosphate 3-phosphatidyltransferase [Cyanobacteria bacterium CG_2015-22_32_23]NCQ05258.1 CDP-diacylglycerol--glycerol-3-phosphate 3-phosphatidyltransferase [Cyanobacteria bacterium CG_2015-09_32_10]NCQ42077.1 CDP-diacylglycerol--glycerol-3-phosphate 3-phosphatidyltransferase [Cyanobacteria bacterium CG_2015-04_32_10]NCS85551.1 CDP-diacylglycer
MNIPNSITISRIFLVIPIIYLLYQPEKYYQWVAFGIFLLAAATDWLDGYLARKLNQITELGKFLDPLTDKILVIAPFLVLIERQQIPAWAVLIIIVREIVISGWRVNPSLVKQDNISGANMWGKLKTVMQIIAISFLIMPLSGLWQSIGLIFFWLALILTIISGVIYLIPNSTSSILETEK